MKNSTLIIIFFVLIILISFCGCINNNKNNNNQTEFIESTIWVRNKSNNTVKGTLMIFKENDILFNSNFNIDKDNYSTFIFKTKPSKVTIKINITNYDESISNINIQRNQNHHYYDIYDDKIKYIPPPIT